ncbi:uncharacterized protein A4U43_C01F25740 [Asparagus officinalis]|uniref:Uncharacterized protein n=1 Tax=Asparagus officinalis TaxID=4686 RepID=A0A5P1FSR7_ASPOF|nr:uncharacterized protein A4U43_C01F25740 [Asparagus officinalis]
MFGRMEYIWTTYLKLLGEVYSFRASRGVDSRWVVEAQAPEATEVKKLRHELGESRRKAEGLGLASRPQKRLRVNLVPKETAGLKTRVVEVTNELVAQRRRPKKAKVRDQGSSKPADSIRVDLNKIHQLAEDPESTEG